MMIGLGFFSRQTLAFPITCLHRPYNIALRYRNVTWQVYCNTCSTLFVRLRVDFVHCDRML
jgi:hypothetical protein